MKTAPKKTNAKAMKPAEELEELRCRIWLLKNAWHGEVARLELKGEDTFAPHLAAIMNCARDLDRLAPKEV